MSTQPDRRIIEETPEALAEYATVSIAFRVERILRVELLERGLGGALLVEENVAEPYTKDYDALKGEGPTRWAERWDMSNWGIFAAFEGDERVGGAVVAWNTPGLNMLGGREDVAALWDIRVHPTQRGRGTGDALFRHAASWAKERGCRTLTIETQNVNVPACGFYVAQGCDLAAINRLAYPDLPDETQLIWRLSLGAETLPD